MCIRKLKRRRGKKKKKPHTKKQIFNPSAWSDERCSRSEITTCRGVTGTARRAALKI
jgi:hypothetical protein